MKMTKRLLAMLLALTMLLSMAACGGSPEAKPAEGAAAPATEAAVAEDAVYRTLYASEVNTLNYLITGQAIDWSIAMNVVDCLVEYDTYGVVQPALATEWSKNEDATVWTFKIREGVNWVDKDGNVVAPVTAHDWVSAAHYASDANNVSDTFYTMEDKILNATAYYNWTAYQMALPTAVDGTDDEGNAVKFTTNEDGEQVPLEVAEEIAIEEIGVKAIDDYTLEFTLEKPVPYFESMLSFGPYLPVYGPFLAECGDKFGTSNEYLLYCGAFILSTYEPQQKHILTKNENYWDKDNVFLTAVEETYNAEAGTLASTMYLSGEVDSAEIPANLLSAMMADPATADLIHPTRSDPTWSYWYLFNFNPRFDAKYEPENWKLAVNNENFRKSIFVGLNRIPALYCHDTQSPDTMVNNTITPNGFTAASKDYAYYGGLAAYTEGNNYDEAKALEYKATAMKELTEAGATFPVKVLMRYNPTTANWAEECQVVEQNLEKLLGTDYIDVIVVAGPESGYNAAVRKAGDYGLMKCNWGSDYIDPETWTDPFADASCQYCFIEMSEDPTTKGLYEEYIKLVNEAKAITADVEARYEAFAKAETFLLDHAFAQPIHTSSRSYQMSNLNAFEGQYSPAGQVSQRYKGQKLYETSMSNEEYQAAYAEWKAALGG